MNLQQSPYLSPPKCQNYRYASLQLAYGFLDDDDDGNGVGDGGAGDDDYVKS